MLSVWVLKYIYAFVDKHMIKQLRLVFTPLVTMIFMVPITLVITGPIANYISQGIAWVFTSLFAFSPIIAGAVIGATRSLLVFTGMHLSLGAVCLNNITNYGYDIILPVNTMGTMAIVGVCLGVWICAKKQQNKEIGMSTLISSFIGITEPGIYGVLMVFRNALIADIIAGGVAGAWTAFWGCTSNAYVNSCILSLPVFMDEHFMFFCIGMVIAVVLGCGLTIFFGIDEGEGYPARMSFGKKTVRAADVQDAAISPAQKDEAPAVAPAAVDVVTSPVSGEVVILSQVEDQAFSSEALGKGVAVVPSEGIVVAPFDGVVTALYPSRHAVGLTSQQGIECLIHIGMDTVNLGGAHFENKVSQGDAVKKGQVLVEFDIEAIAKAGYSVATPVVISNTASYLDVFAAKESGMVERGEDLIKIIR